MNQKILLTISIFLLITQIHGQQRYCPSNMIQLFNGITCQRDEQCQNLANGFFCYQGYCCSLTNSSPSGYGTSCTFDSQCRFSNSQCRGNICYCRSGFNFNGNQCASVSNPINNQCNPGQILINSLCYSTSGYFGDCTHTGQCTFSGSECLDYKCICQPGRIFDGNTCIINTDLPNPPVINNPICQPDEVPINNECYPSLGRGQACIYDEQCILEVNLICQYGRCVDRKFGDNPPYIGDGTNPIGPGPPIGTGTNPYPVGPGPQIGDGTEPYPIVPGSKITVCCYNTNQYPCCIACCQTYNVVKTIPIHPGPWIPPPPPINPNQGYILRQYP